jgi:muramidase (phage lysozyme)
VVKFEETLPQHYELKVLTMTENERAFLDMLAWSEIGEGLLAVSDNGYDVLVGSTAAEPNLFTSYADHPRKRVWIDKIQDYSTAAGRYQILARYFDVYKAQLGLPDFSPNSQDRIALQLIGECHALNDINSGHIASAIGKCSSRWASLPGAGYYGQRENSHADLLAAYGRAGGVVA